MTQTKLRQNRYLNKNVSYMYVPKLIFLPAYVFAFHFYYDGASTGMYQLSAG